MAEKILVTPQDLENAEIRMRAASAEFAKSVSDCNKAMSDLGSTWRDELYAVANGRYEETIKGLLDDVPEVLNAYADMISGSLSAFEIIDEKWKNEIWGMEFARASLYLKQYKEGVLGGGTSIAGETQIGADLLAIQRIRDKIAYDIANNNSEGSAWVLEEDEKGNSKKVYRQCKVYISDLVKAGTGKGLPRTIPTFNFKYEDESALEIMLQESTENGPIRAETLKSWSFEADLKEGDVIQVGDNVSKVHTAMVNRVADEGIYVTDVDGINDGIVRRERLIKWDEWIKYWMTPSEDKNGVLQVAGISIYRPDWNK